MQKLIGIFCFFVFCSFSKAESTIQKVQINGFTVYIVDLKKGNQFGYVFTVPYGSSDDPPELFGRAHFFEHMFSRGSKRFPGHETLIQAMTGFGFHRNAYTSGDKTTYHASGNEKHAFDAMRMHLASLEEPELETSSFEREKKTVINEVVVSSSSTPARGYWYLPTMVMLPENHPKRGYHLGTEEVLNKMTQQNLRDLHREIYHAGNVRLAVIGNFSSGMWNADDVISNLKTILPVSKNPLPRYKAPKSPSMFEKDSQIHIFYPSDQLGSIKFPVKDDANIEDVENFLVVLNANFRNSILDVLKKRLGWVNSISFSRQRVGSEFVMIANFQMTAEGYAHRSELVEWLVHSLKEHRQQPYNVTVLEQIKKTYLEYYERMSESFDQLFGAMPSFLVKDQEPSELRFDWKGTVATLKTEAIKKGADGIDFDRKHVVFFGPGSSTSSDFDKLHKLSYTLSDVTQATKPIPKLFEPRDVAVTEVVLKPNENSGKLLQQSSWDKIPGWNFVHSHDPSWKERTLSLKFSFANMSTQQILGLKLWVQTFLEDSQHELIELYAQGVNIDIIAEGEELLISSRGVKGKEVEGISWVIARLKGFRPKLEDINRQGEKLRLNYERLEQGFAGSITFQIASELTHPVGYDSLSFREASKEDPVRLINSFVVDRLPESQKTIVVGGSYRQVEIYRLMSLANLLSPSAVTTGPLKSAPILSNVVHREPWLQSGVEGVGITQMFSPKFSSEDLRNQAALRVIVSLLHEQIFLRARPYGYVQQVRGRTISSERHFVAFVGQAKSEEELALVREIWKEEIQNLVARRIPVKKVEEAIEGLIAAFSVKSDKSDEEVEKLALHLDKNGDPFYTQKILEEARKLKSEDIYDLATQLLNQDTPYLTVIKGVGAPKSCEQIMEDRAVGRKALGI